MGGMLEEHSEMCSPFIVRVAIVFELRFEDNQPSEH